MPCISNLEVFHKYAIPAFELCVLKAQVWHTYLPRLSPFIVDLFPNFFYAC
jgi:hypothetical protein